MKLLLLILSISVLVTAVQDLPVIPYPQYETHGAESNAASVTRAGFVCQSTPSRIINDACARMIKRMFPFESVNYKTAASIDSVSFVIADYNDAASTLQFNVSESYKLTVPQSGAATITADTVWGALAAMQTFSQLVNYSCESRQCKYMISRLPIEIRDYPRFPWRGLLVDSSRHFLPMDTMYNMVDALAATKMNVMHWHLVDAIAIPLRSDKFPNLVKGAYASDATYSMADIAAVVDYAYRRGVRVMMEFDMPGHAYRWGSGYPITANCPAYTKNINNVALDPSNELTYTVVNGVMEEAFANTHEHYVHLGGDEIVYACWGSDPKIVQFMKDKGFTTHQQLENYFYSRVLPTLKSNGKSSIFWQEVYQAGVSLPSDAIIQVWLDGPTLANVVKGGRMGISSYAWYVDLVPPGTEHRQWMTTWKEYYAFDPVNSLANQNLTPAQAKLIVGGEACMWGEEVDEFSIMERVWPRTAAIAERLWSSENQKDVASMTNRMVFFRCHTFVQQNRLAVGAMAPDFCRRP